MRIIILIASIIVVLSLVVYGNHYFNKSLIGKTKIELIEELGVPIEIHLDSSDGNIIEVLEWRDITGYSNQNNGYVSQSKRDCTLVNGKCVKCTGY